MMTVDYDFDDDDQHLVIDTMIKIRDNSTTNDDEWMNLAL